MLKRLGKVKQAPSNNDIVVQGHKEAYLIKREKKQSKSYIYEVNKKIPAELLHVSVHQPMNPSLIQLSQKKKRMIRPIKVPDIFYIFTFLHIYHVTPILLQAFFLQKTILFHSS